LLVSRKLTSKLRAPFQLDGKAGRGIAKVGHRAANLVTSAADRSLASSQQASTKTDTLQNTHFCCAEFILLALLPLGIYSKRDLFSRCWLSCHERTASSTTVRVRVNCCRREVYILLISRCISRSLRALKPSHRHLSEPLTRHSAQLLNVAPTKQLYRGTQYLAQKEMLGWSGIVYNNKWRVLISSNDNNNPVHSADIALFRKGLKHTAGEFHFLRTPGLSCQSINYARHGE
jgi:hypothetical protein